jgi:hypothetical protein
MRRDNRRTLQRLGILFVALLAWSGAASAQEREWVPLTGISTPPFLVGVALQLTDGTILVQQHSTPFWWVLHPDEFGHYNTGTWSQFPSTMPFDYAPTYFASAVLPDGRVIVEGGEENFASHADTNKGAIYDPVTAFWNVVDPPMDTGAEKPWRQIGDAQSVVLPDGTFMLANINTKQAALLDADTLTWRVVTIFGKNDNNDEEGWTLLPDGTVLTVDTYTGPVVSGDPGGKGTNSEVLHVINEPPVAIATATTAGSTVVQLWDSAKTLCGKGPHAHEVGPAVLRPDGTVFATGANLCKPAAGEPNLIGSGHTSIYNTNKGIWTPGPDIPDSNNIPDGTASILPNGNVLIDTNRGYGAGPSTFFEFDLKTGGWVSPNIPQPPPCPALPSCLPSDATTTRGRMVVTGEGSVMFLLGGTNLIWVYTRPQGWEGTYPDSWRPTICNQCYPSFPVVGGKNYTISGTQFNGLSQGAAFGDDAQSATNYPLVLITNNFSQHKFYARTHHHSTMGVATGRASVSTQFDILPGTEIGPSEMVVIANGIPSKPVSIFVVAQGSN